MSDISRRDWLKTVGAVGAGALVVPDALASPSTPSIPGIAGAPVRTYADGEIVDLASTSDVFVNDAVTSHQMACVLYCPASSVA